MNLAIFSALEMIFFLYHLAGIVCLLMLALILPYQLLPLVHSCSLTASVVGIPTLD
jgi:hypothetical protein